VRSRRGPLHNAYHRKERPARRSALQAQSRTDEAHAPVQRLFAHSGEEPMRYWLLAICALLAACGPTLPPRNSAQAQ
jgi:hypothetical protein